MLISSIWQAALELWVDGKLAHSFAGARPGWPRRPVVVSAGSVKLRFVVQPGGARGGGRRGGVDGGGSSGGAADERWGYRVEARGYEPSLVPFAPLLVDVHKSLAVLGGK